MLKKTKLKALGLMIALATPGFTMYGCSSQASRDVRNAAITGTANFVSDRTFDLLSAIFPDRTTDE